MNIYRISKEKDDKKKMEKWFEERTDKHVKLVQKYCKKIADYDEERFGELIELGEIHDQSKYENPERDPYVYVTWKYKCKDDGIDWKPPEDIEEKMNEATEHHVKSNKHHPEAHSKKKSNLINEKDRDKPPEEMVDATKMPDIYIAEMVSDWAAMGQEKGNTAKSWADKNVNVRWKFTNNQKNLIYELIEVCE